MRSWNQSIVELEVALLKELLGKRPGRIFGPAFLVEGDLVCSLRFVLDAGDGVGRGRYVTIASLREETPVEYLDWGRFAISCAGSFEEAIGGASQLYRDVSQFVILDDVTVTRVRVRRARVRAGDEQVEYDAFIALELTDGRTISFGHAPRTWEGVCMTLGHPQTLADPTDVWDGLVLE